MANSERNDFLDLIESDFTISRGTPLPLGATIQHDGINFAVFSRHAQMANLVLFLPGSREPFFEIPLDARYNKTGDIWHVLIEGMNSDIEYGYRLDRANGYSGPFHRFDPDSVILDPYARAISLGHEWGEGRAGLREHERHSFIIRDHFDWENDQPLNIPLSESIIYELHVRGFTQHASSGVTTPGTFAGLVEKIPYLKKLGITAVELLPINEFDETDNPRRNPVTGEDLHNFWGYDSIGFFAPKSSYAVTRPENGYQIREFKEMVKSFHAAGIEIILDIVFNHTAEGNEKGPTFSFRGLDNSVYYMLNRATGEYYNFSGCGNTLNCNHPVVRDMILDCLRYWVIEMHVDGFRFDLASILGRGEDGEVLANPPLLERIANDPVLANTKIIAEAWDAGGLYQVGSFPAWKRWAEWNGRYRDDVRRYVRGDAGMTGALATRIAGSSDLYLQSGRAPYHSINFITAHDGFTMRDLVSYNFKHNEANGEGNNDGSNDNFSWNCGWEGNGADPEVEAMRARQVRNFATLMFFSQGVPMMLAGDEFGRTQHGNNNAYCQDNEISWVDWSLTETNNDLLRFFRMLIQFRKKHKLLRRETFFDTGSREITWHGNRLYRPDWTGKTKCLAFQLTPARTEPEPTIFVISNANDSPLRFQLPILAKVRWRRLIDTALPAPQDFVSEAEAQVLSDQRSYEAAAFSTIVLIG